MNILAIETSCDDTCVAVIKASGKKKPRFKILSNIISSQVEIHKKYGGVYPFLAKREHQKNLPIILKKALKKIKIDLIAVTIGPGLEPCLWVGVNSAKDLAKKLNIPIVPVNHIEGHILANFVGKIQNSKFKIQNFPAICLVVSGGHTQLILMKDIGKYKILGETRDDAAGECFDKVARILGLGYPGGLIVAKMATKIKKEQVPRKREQKSKIKIKLPRPMFNQKNYDFSFSGLKTAVLYTYQKSKIKNQKYKQQGCKEVQQAIIDVLLKKTIRAAKDYRVKTIILGGGVSANQELRKQFKVQNAKCKIPVLIPLKNLCTDNAVMTGIAGYFNLNKKTKNWKKIKADANIRI